MHCSCLELFRQTGRGNRPAITRLGGERRVTGVSSRRAGRPGACPAGSPCAKYLARASCYRKLWHRTSFQPAEQGSSSKTRATPHSRAFRRLGESKSYDGDSGPAAGLCSCVALARNAAFLLCPLSSRKTVSLELRAEWSCDQTAQHLTSDAISCTRTVDPSFPTEKGNPG